MNRKRSVSLYGSILMAVMALTVLFFALPIGLRAQTYMPQALRAGAPAGSAALSGFDTINPYSGNINFSLPLVSSGGRGTIAMPLTLNVNQKWLTKDRYDDSHTFPYAQPADEDIPDFDPATHFPSNSYFPIDIKGVFLTLQPYECVDSSERYLKTLSIIVFTGPDGTQYELRDRETGGEPAPGDCGNYTGFNRGTVFESVDGTGAIFISDADIHDPAYASSEMGFSPTGRLITRDGTVYTVTNGTAPVAHDRNGNKISITTESGSSPLYADFTVVDSLKREVVVEHLVEDSAPYGLCDKITFKGSAGTTRVMRVSYEPLHDVLRSGYTVQTRRELFPANFTTLYEYNFTDIVPDADYDPPKPSTVWLPDDRSYKLEYNPYGELARVELPTGGAIEYDWGVNSGNGKLDIAENDGFSTTTPTIYRRIVERRVYSDGETLDSKTILGGLVSLGSRTGYVLEDLYDEGGTHLVNRTKHYYFGITGSSETFQILADNPFNLESWRNGREYQTEIYGSDSTTLLRRTTYDWSQSAQSWWSHTGLHAPGNNPQIDEVSTVLADSNQISKITFDYDARGNVTDTYEYDYGSGTPGAFIRRTHHEYVATNPVNSVDYLSDSVHITNLPSQMWISSDTSGTTKVSFTAYEYDNYSTDSTHAALIGRSNISGHDANFSTSYTTRGNVTKTTGYASAADQTGGVSSYIQYDIAGNRVKTIDANGTVSTSSYADNFGAADSEATANSAPSQLSGQTTFAFATSTTNALSLTDYTQFEYFTGQPVNTQNINGVISKDIYDDDLDRPTQSVDGVGTSREVQMSITYDDANHRVQTTSDLNALNDNLINSVSFYDGFGRTTETRAYEDDGDYRAQQTQYDGLGRSFKQSNPFRPTEIDGSHPVLWTQTYFDSLGRTVKVTTPDNTDVLTSYTGNATTVTDQAGKLRRSIANALGQLTRVDEPNSSNELGTVSSPNQQTSYVYDASDNLLSVTQGSQTRTFIYDGLSRLTSAENPESGTIRYSYDPNGNLQTRWDARDIKAIYDYDALSRITKRCYKVRTSTLGATTCAGASGETAVTNTPDVTYTYGTSAPAIGALTQVSTGTGTNSSTTDFVAFDDVGRVIQSKQTTDGVVYGNGSTDSTMTYTYNLAGELLEQRYPSGRVVKTTLGRSGDLMQIQSHKSGDTARNYANGFTYTAAGGVSAVRLGNGKWESTQFNARLQPTQIALGSSAGNTNLLKLDYGYGTTQNNGNVVSQTISVPTVGASTGFVATQTYTYDPLNRLKDAVENVVPHGGSSSQSWKQTFTYDRYGNRRFDFTSSNTTVPASSCTEAICNPTISTSTNRLTSSGYTYDGAGNATADAQGRTFVYDGENKQVQVSNGSGTLGQYSYDGDGRRVKKYVPSTGETTIFVYDVTGKQIAEYSTIVASVEDAKVAYLTSDHLGSPRINTAAHGAVVSRHDYHPFGEEIATSQRTTGLGYAADTVRNQFTGKERDTETDLDYFFARYYSSKLGRFVTADYMETGSWSISPRAVPFGRLRTPQSLNLYAYVINNPVNVEDSDGHGPKKLRIPGEKHYTYVAHINNLNDSPNIHIFDDKGNEIGKVAIKGTAEKPFPEWQEIKKFPKHLKDNIRALIKRKGWGPRPPLHPPVTNSAELTGEPGANAAPKTRSRTGGRGRGGGVMNAFSGLMLADIFIQAYMETSDSENFGYFYNMAGGITITDLNRAVNFLPDGPFNQYELDGHKYILRGGKLVDRDNPACSLTQDAKGNISRTCSAQLQPFEWVPDGSPRAPDKWFYIKTYEIS